MLGLFVDLLAKVGSFVANTTEMGCVLFMLFEEPKCPQSLIK